MIFSAMVLVCQINMPKNFDTCTVMSDTYQHKTEEECMSSITTLLNSELFQLAYINYRVEEYACYPWLQIST